MLNRGVKRPERDVLIVREERPGAYLEALAGLLRSVSDGEVRRTGTNKLSLDRAVLADLDLPKKWTDGAT